jgi:uncharacterized membrane protein
MRTLTIYYSEKDKYGTDLKKRIEELTREKSIGFLEVKVDDDQELKRRFGDSTPVILIGPYELKSPFTIVEIEVAINSTLDRDRYQETGQATEKIQNSRFSPLESFTLWFSKHYPWVISIILAIYTIVPFLAPVLQKGGYVGFSTGIYKVYSILCHQLAYRSFFIGGEQPFYPRELAKVNGYMTYEQVTGYNAEDIATARNFIGNDLLGYKVALCERDVAIYASMAMVGILFGIFQKKLRPIPWYIWIIFAVLPIAFDGISQLPSLSANWPAWMPDRESTPILRLITGALFGTGTALFMYPLMEESVKDMRFQLQRKLQAIQYLDGKRN